jgi:hypothetical protein
VQDYPSFHIKRDDGTFGWRHRAQTFDEREMTMKLVDMLLAVASSAANLQVVTAVGAPALSGPLRNLEVGLPAQPDECIVTNMNLVEGDVVSVVSPGFLKGDAALEALRQDHVKMLAAAQASVAANVTALVTLAERLGTGWRDQEVKQRGQAQPLPGPGG